MPEMERIEAVEPAQVGAEQSAKAAEKQRQAARRRFLMGGAAALPVIVTLGQRQAFAASAQVCQSAGIGKGEGFTKTDQLTPSLFCRPENL